MTYPPNRPVTAAQARRDAWVKEHAGHATAAVLKLIVSDGGLGTAGATDHKRMTPSTATHILRLLTLSGVATPPAREYLARVLRWHYGYTPGGAPVASTGKLKPEEAEFVRRRAHELVTAHDQSNDGPLIKLVKTEQGT